MGIYDNNMRILCNIIGDNSYIQWPLVIEIIITPKVVGDKDEIPAGYIASYPVGHIP